MDIQIFTRNIELNSEAEKYINKKFSRLERHLTPITDARLEVGRTSARAQADRVVAQLTVNVNGYKLRAEEHGPNLFAAIDAISDTMDSQIRKFKTRVYRTFQAKRSAKNAGSRELQAPAPDEALLPEDEERGDEEVVSEFGKVVRTKRFPMKPMTLEDAVTEMELLGHDFFLFFNVETNDYNVVYRRRDGDYGVIQPVLA